MGKFPLLDRQPTGVVGVVWKEEEGEESNAEGHNTFDDEEPPPSGKPMRSIESTERSSCDETRKCNCDDVAGVKNADTGCDLLACVEGTEDIKSTRIKWSLYRTYTSLAHGFLIDSA